jgi:hypothetical protein
MAGVEFKINVGDFIKKINKMPEEVQGKMIDELRLTAYIIETSYKIAVPVITSRLKTSIHVEHSHIKSYNYSDNKGVSFDGYTGYNLKPTQVIIGTNVEYADVIEFGFTGDVSVKSFQRTSKNGNTHTVSAHTRKMERMGNNALKEAFEKETAGLPERLAKLIK